MRFEYRRAAHIVEEAFKLKSDARLYYINGDHNNMANIVTGLHQARGQKPIVINLDFHSDARLSKDGPHSGKHLDEFLIQKYIQITWLSDGYQRDEILHTYIIGLSLLSNSDACIQNLEDFKATYLPYTWDSIQMMGGSGVALPQITEEIIKDIQKRFGSQHPVIFTIDGDTVCGLPSSAQNEVLGYPPEDVYPMISKFTSNLNVACLNIAELKPSLDVTKNNAVGEFLANSLFLYAQTLVKESTKI